MSVMILTFYNAIGQKIKVPNIISRLMLSTIGIPHLGSRIRLRLLEKTLAKLTSLSSSKALDAGCGYGLASKLLAQKGVEVKAIDHDKKRLQVAQAIFKNHQLITFSNANLYHLPFKNQTFNISICLEVLEHLKNDLKALKELSRVTKKNGVLIVSFPEHTSDKLGSKEMGHVRNGYDLNQFLMKTDQFNFKLIIKSSYGKTVIGKIAFRLDYILCRISPILSVLTFPIFYPILILDQLFDSSSPPAGFLLLLKKSN